VQKTDRAVLQTFGRKLNIGFTWHETLWLSQWALLIWRNNFDLTFQTVFISLVEFNLLAPEFGIYILAHPVCKMRIMQEPKKVAL
jgi:hypothetical protein